MSYTHLHEHVPTRDTSDGGASEESGAARAQTKMPMMNHAHTTTWVRPIYLVTSLHKNIDKRAGMCYCISAGFFATFGEHFKAHLGIAYLDAVASLDDRWKKGGGNRRLFGTFSVRSGNVLARVRFFRFLARASLQN